MTSVGIEPATFRFVAQHLHHCATAVGLFKIELFQIYFYALLEEIYLEFSLSFTHPINVRIQQFSLTGSPVSISKC